jgi:hypothetical protein
MSIHFCSSHSIDFGKIAGSVRTASIPAFFDANYVKQTLLCQSASPCWRTYIPSTVQSDFYFQCKGYWGGSIASVGIPNLLFYSTVATVQTQRFRLYKTSGSAPSGNHEFQWNNGGTWTTIGSPLLMTNNTGYTFTFRFKFHASAGELSFWINNVLIGQVTGNTNAYNSAGFLSEMDFQNPSIGSGANGDHDYAEVLITKNENPYAMKVKTHVLNGTGADSAWTGAYTDVDEADPSTTDIISSATANQISTFATDDLPAIGADVIRAVQVSVMARCGSTGPQNIQTVLYASATNQFGATQALVTGYNTYRHIYEQNSVTGVEFTKAEIDASNVGVKSIP